MDPSLLLKLWDQSWTEGIWVAPWAKAVQDVTPAQAAWAPSLNRNSIWQIVHHVCIWREDTLSKFDGRPGPARADLDRDNFAKPAAPDQAAWDRTRDRLRATHDAIREAISRPNASMERLPYHVGHDCYHLGQIMYLRAMQGLAPIE
ncbi:MAG: DinB family protein [Phycisphaerales bacterium]|nr:DinB family protein [Phycisphaerales bacterium]